MQLNALRTLGIGALALLLAACDVVGLDSSGKPIIPTDPASGPDYTNQTPAQIAQTLWAPKVLPAAQANALNWPAIKQAQGQAKGPDGKSVYAKFSGKVTAVDTEGLERKLTLEVNGDTVLLQLGPIIKGNAVRDAAGFMRFEDFKNQVQFAQVAKALNKQALSELPALDAGWTGQKVDVLAALTLYPDRIDNAVALDIKREAAP